MWQRVVRFQTPNGPMYFAIAPGPTTNPGAPTMTNNNQQQPQQQQQPGIQPQYSSQQQQYVYQPNSTVMVNGLPGAPTTQTSTHQQIQLQPQIQTQQTQQPQQPPQSVQPQTKSKSKQSPQKKRNSSTTQSATKTKQNNPSKSGSDNSTLKCSTSSEAITSTTAIQVSQQPQLMQPLMETDVKPTIMTQQPQGQILSAPHVVYAQQQQQPSQPDQSTPPKTLPPCTTQTTPQYLPVGQRVIRFQTPNGPMYFAIAPGPPMNHGAPTINSGTPAMATQISGIQPQYASQQFVYQPNSTVMVNRPPVPTQTSTPQQQQAQPQPKSKSKQSPQKQQNSASTPNATNAKQNNPSKLDLEDLLFDCGILPEGRTPALQIQQPQLMQTLMETDTKQSIPTIMTPQPHSQILSAPHVVFAQPPPQTLPQQLDQSTTSNSLPQQDIVKQEVILQPQQQQPQSVQQQQQLLIQQQQQQQLIIQQMKQQQQKVAASQVDVSIMNQLAADQAAATNPQTKQSFKSLEDACKRLLRYHVFNSPEVDENQVKQFDNIFEAASESLRIRKQAIYDKYRYIILKLSLKKVPPSEEVMLDQIFVEDELSYLKREREHLRHCEDRLEILAYEQAKIYSGADYFAFGDNKSPKQTNQEDEPIDSGSLSRDANLDDWFGPDKWGKSRYPSVPDSEAATAIESILNDELS